MPRIRPPQRPAHEPDFHAPCVARSRNETVHNVEGKFWLPMRRGEPAMIELSDQHYVPSGPVEITATFKDLSDTTVELYCPRLWVSGASFGRRGAGGLDIANGLGVCERLRVRHMPPPGRQPDADECALRFELTPNVLLGHLGRWTASRTQGLGFHAEPEVFTSFGARNFEFRSVATVLHRPHEGQFLVGNGLDVSLCPISDRELQDGDAISERIVPDLEELLAVASLAAWQRTRITGWHYAGPKFWEDMYIDESRTPDSEIEHSMGDTMVFPGEFTGFLEHLIQTRSSLSIEDWNAYRFSMLALLPDSKDYVESRFLSLFSTLESLVLVYRRRNDLEYSARGEAWRRIERAVREALRERVGDFASETHLEFARSAVPELRRVPLAPVFDRMVGDLAVDLSDLWPAFNAEKGSPTLNQLRNELAHNGRIHLAIANMRPLVTALHHLELLVLRVLFGLLRWDVAKTIASRNPASWMEVPLSDCMAALRETQSTSKESPNLK